MSLADQILLANPASQSGASNFFASLGGQSGASNTSDTVNVGFASEIETIAGAQEETTIGFLKGLSDQINALIPTHKGLIDPSLKGSLLNETGSKEQTIYDNDLFGQFEYDPNETPFLVLDQTAYEPKLPDLSALDTPIPLNDHELQREGLFYLQSFEEFEQLVSSYALGRQISQDNQTVAGNITEADTSASTTPSTSEGLIEATNSDEDSPSSDHSSDNTDESTEANKAKTASGEEDVDFKAKLADAKLAAVSSPETADENIATQASGASTANTAAASGNIPSQQTSTTHTADASSDASKSQEASQANPLVKPQSEGQQGNQNTDNGNQPGKHNTQNLQNNSSAKTEAASNTSNFNTEVQTKTASSSQGTTANQTVGGTPQTPTQAPPAPTPLQIDSLLPLTYERQLNNGPQSLFGSILEGDDNLFNSSDLFGGRPSKALAGQVKNQFNLAVSRAVSGGEQQFTVRLNPGDLGRVNVKLQFAENGSVRAQVAVENPETLELLQRDARGFERTLEAAGHKVEQNGISFGLENNNEESAGRALAEAMQQEKMRDELAARPDDFSINPDNNGTTPEAEDIPLEDILPHISVDTGVDIRI
jgi:hypothetical protein